MEKISLKNGCNLYLNKSDKFKTWSASIYIYRPLNNREASLNALLAKVLKSASKKYPARADVARRLDWLYGTILATGVRKYADTHMLILTTKAVSDRFLPDNISGDVLELAKEILTNPKVDNDAFDKKIVDIEKENLKKLIESYINEKAVYAEKKCIQLMCEKEAFGTDENGTIEEINKIDEKILYQHYKEVLSSSKIDIFINGEVDENIAIQAFESLSSNGSIKPAEILPPPGNVNEVTESMEVTQGKLVMGFRTTTTDLADKAKVMVFTALYGGSPTSKLFNNVREKLSLAYYANTRLFFSKGIIMARSGIEIDKYKMVKDEILAQLDDIKNGKIEESEMENAISHLVNMYSSLDDDPDSEVAVKSGLIVEGDTRTIPELTHEIKNVKKQDVIDVAKSVHLDTVYFLKD